MLSKLSLRNAKRQARDYLVYFITVILSAALIYAFNGLVDSNEIQSLSTMLASLPITIVLASVVVVLIIGWLVRYTMRFMLLKRSRELGTYILLGMENNSVSRLFFTENLIIGSIALIIGVILGNFFFQFLRAVLLWMFNIPYSFSFSFSLKAIGLTLIYFTSIYLFALVGTGKRIRRMKIYDLLYLDRQNEAEIIKKSKNRRKMFTISVACGIFGTALLITRQLLFGILGAALVIISMYGFFIGFSSGVPAFFDKHPVMKYSKTNLLVYRSLASKLTAMGVTMATIAVLFTATLLCEGMGFLFSNLFQRNEILFTCFDLFIGSSDTETSFDNYKVYIDKHISVREEYEYFVYSGENDRVTRYIESETPKYIRNFKQDTLLRISDYTALRRMLGYPEVHLEPNSYIIHCMGYLESTMTKFNESLTIKEHLLTQNGVYFEDFSQYLWNGNGRGFILVVPDEVAEMHEPVSKIYAAMTNEPVRREVFEELREIRSFYMSIINTSQVIDSFYNTVLSPDATRDENASMFAMVVFPLFYLALVLTMVAATILTIQLLSDVDKYKKQYSLLRDLGMDMRDAERALRNKFALFYTMPTLPPLLICTVFMLAMGNTFDPGVIIDSMHLWSMIGTTFAVFFAIYLIYVAASYTCFKRSILSHTTPF